MGGSIFSKSYNSTLPSINTGFGLMGLLASRVEAKNKRDLAAAEGAGGNSFLSSSGSPAPYDVMEPLKSPLHSPDKFDEELRKDLEALRKREEMRAYPMEDPNRRGYVTRPTPIIKETPAPKEALAPKERDEDETKETTP